VPKSNAIEVICSEVARLLKEERIKRGLSMTELAARAGISRPMVGYIENGSRNPTLDTLLRITAVLNVELADVLRRATGKTAH
jgi:transcriptional regulator with XRE-family HTH domain